jgi:xanthine dehydrogenase YagR molybdenum-binding subunit
MITMNAPIGRNVLDEDQNGLVGKPMDRVDGKYKTTGTAKYAYEYDHAANGADTAAYGYLVLASIGKGRTTSIDTSAAERAPGVLKVITWHDAPQQGNGDHRHACPVLTSADIGHYGVPIALVIAETFETARAAAYLVRPEYEAAAAKYTIHANIGKAEIPDQSQAKADTSEGDFDGAFASAPVKVDVTYTTPLQTHAMMEPHATIASWDGDKVTLITANQLLTDSQKSVANTLKVPVENVRLISKYIGGGFGGKLWALADASLAAIGAKAVGRPVKVALTRQQIFHVTTHRSNTIQRLRIAADQDGRIQAIGHDVISGNLVTEKGAEMAANQTRSLYAGANRETRTRLVPLDIPVASSMRAPGEAVGLLALECAMDELAEKLNLDPIELRVRNEPTEDPTLHVPYSTRQLIPCLRAGAEKFGWNKRNPRPGQVREGRWLIGMGVASATRGNPLKDSSAKVRIDNAGVATVTMAMTDIGTGTYTILTQIGAEMLGLPADKVVVDMGDTNFPPAAGSGGSFGAASSGSALFDACTTLRAKLAQAAGIDPASAGFANGSISGGGKSVTLASLAGAAGLEAEGGIKPGDMKTKYSQQSYGAHFAEVAVDIDTGEVRLRRMLGVFCAGRILNAKTARSQAIGGMIFGVGAALEEAVAMDDRYGFFVNHDLAEYHVAVHADVPDVDAFFLPELDDKTNPLKSKGLGELGICGAGAAVANAIFNACGVRVRDYPITLDKIIAKLPQTA